MEGMTSQDELVGQDDGDTLLADANSEESPASSGDGDSETRQGGDSANGLLSQDDIDSLLSQVDSAKEDEPDGSDPFTGLKVVEKVSDEYIRSLSLQIFNRSLLLREPGVQVIWNALNTLPMNTGLNLNIQGMEYKTLGVLHTKHLVVKNDV